MYSSSNLRLLSALALLPLALADRAAAQAPVLTETAELLASDAAPGELVAWSVAADGDTIVMGDWMVPGAAYVYVRSGASWSFQAKLVPIGATHDHGFGRAIAISGDTVVVGAVGEDLYGGAFYVYERNGVTWDAGQRFTITVPGTGYVGASVAIDGDRLAVGAPYDGGTWRGAVWLFARSGPTWIVEQRLVPSGAGDERMGSSVALHGDRIVAGAPTGAALSTRAGCVYVFDLGGGGWSEVARLESPDPVDNQSFGESVAFDADRIAIGAPASNAPPIGAAYVFTRVTGTWQREARIEAVTGDFDDRFGSAVALRGGHLVVGAHIAHGGTGGAYVFEREAGLWNERYELVPNGLDGGSRFGFSIAISGRDLVVGAPYGSPAGSAFVFDLAPEVTSTYCTSAPNSTGLPCLIGASGSVSVAANDLVLVARQAPPHANGLFLCGTTRAAIPMATGTLCVSPFAPGIVRLGPVTQANASGFASRALDLLALPAAAAIVPGSTWYFQFWYRNAGPGGYDLSDGLEATFAP